MTLNKYLKEKEIEALTEQAYSEYQRVCKPIYNVSNFDHLPIALKEGWISAVDRVVELTLLEFDAKLIEPR